MNRQDDEKIAKWLLIERLKIFSGKWGARYDRNYTGNMDGRGKTASSSVLVRVL